MMLVGALMFLLAQGLDSQALAQTTYTNTVPFENGFVGTYGTNINSANNISYFSSLHISRVTFTQTGTSKAFTIQGNDIPGTLNFYMDDGKVFHVTGGFSWRFPSGSVKGIGFIPTPESKVTVTTTTGANFVVQGEQLGIVANTASSIGVYFIPYTYADLGFTNGGTATGNSANLSTTLATLNSYLATTSAGAPVGPVTVVSQTTNQTFPTITGTVTLDSTKGETLSVVVNGVTYTAGDGNLSLDGSTWTLVIPAGNELTAGTRYDVTATIFNADKLILEDSTAGELTITGSGPSMTVIKTALPGDLASPAVAGDKMMWKIEATNTGGVTLTSVSVVDTLTAATSQTPSATRSGANDTDTSFDPGDTWTWSVSYTLAQADIDAGKLENVAAVSGTDADTSLTVYSAADAVASTSTTAPGAGGGVVTLLTPAPELTVVKTETSGKTAVGDTLSWDIVVTNTGNVTLTGVDVTDTLKRLDSGNTSLTLASGPTAGSWPGTSGVLAPAEEVTFTATYTLTQADIDAGGVANSAAGSGLAPGATTPTSATSDSDAGTAGDQPIKTEITAAPELTVVKTETSGKTAVGDTLSWDIVITNTGNVTLTGVDVTDTLKRLDSGSTSLTLTSGPTAGSWPGTSGVLAPTEEVTFTATYKLTQADIDAGGVANSATGSGLAPGATTPTSATSDSDAVAAGDQPTKTEITAAPELKITKTVDASALADGVRVGDVLTYQIVIENIGNVTVSDLVLNDTFTDAKGGPLTLTKAPQLTETTLAVGDKMTLGASFTLDAAAVNAGGVSNLAVIEGKSPDGSAVKAESKVEGNTSSAGKDGTPTATGFPGEISGRVVTYLAGAPGVTVHLLRETAPGSGIYEHALDGDGDEILTTTDGDGKYVFLNVPPGDYGIEFHSPDPQNALAAQSDTANADGNQITGITVAAGAVEIDHDAFFVDPAGVVYDSESFAPIAGARVTLLYNGAPVPDVWLNTVLGNANGVITGPDGAYLFLFDPETAQSGTYTLKVEKAGYDMSRSVPAGAGGYTPGLGGGLEKIVPNAVPSSGAAQTYYLSFQFAFTDDPGTTSNGISNNHIPMDADLAGDVKDEVTDILRDDLAATMTQQSQRMQGYAKGALSRLKSRDGDACGAALAAALQEGQIHFATGTADISADSEALLTEISQILGSCPDTEFEVAGHTDNVGDAQANLALSRARADAVIATLTARGVPEGALKAAGYGDTHPVADNATEAGRAANRRIEFVLQDRTEAACMDNFHSDRALNADVHGGKGTVDGTFQREDHDCATDSWRIVSADASLLRTDRGVDQSMFNFSVRRERFVTDDRVRGRFVGAYATRSTVTGRAEGDILGFGINGGLYGADRMSGGLYLDYYLGAAVGRHSFDLDFDRRAGVINATGAYSYGALFAGAALSGEAKVRGMTMSPRAGVDLAWSPGGSGSLDAARGAIRDSESLSIPAVMGGRAFVEMRFDDLLVESPLALAFTPRLLCDWGMGELSMGCGYGASIELTNAPGADGTRFGLSLEGTQTEGASLGTVAVEIEKPVGAGRLKGGIQAGTGGAAGVRADYTLDF